MKKNNLIITVGLLILASCDGNKLDVDISGINTRPLEVLRLEDDLFGLKEKGFDEVSEGLKKKYGSYYDHYLMGFLARKGAADSLYKASVLNFTNDRDVREAYNCIKKLYPANEIDNLAQELNDCVKRFRYYFPQKALPKRLVTCSSGWNYAFAYLDSNLVVGLDMYLGDTCRLYNMLHYPKYQVSKMNRHYLLPDIARGWLLSEFDNQEAQNILLNHCIFYGKIYYAVNALLPDAPDSLIIGYTSKQLQYCKTYEKNLWGYFAEKNRLYENNLSTIRELTSEGPFSGSISKECPPRIAMWVGWQIVKSYMSNTEGLSLQQLMEERDAQKILNKSKYRP